MRPRRLFLALALLLALALPASAGTYTRPIAANLLQSGLTGTLGYDVLAADNATALVAFTTAGVAEDGATAQYTAGVADFDESWAGTIRWRSGGVTLARETFLPNFSASIQAKTSNLPASPAAVGSQMALVPGATVAGVQGNVSGSVAAVTNAVAVAGAVQVGGYATGQDPATLLAAGGYTQARAAKLDQLDAAITSRLATTAFGVAPGWYSTAAGIDAYTLAVLRGEVVVNGDGSYTFKDVTTGAPRVKFAPKAAPGGRTPILDTP